MRRSVEWPFTIGMTGQQILGPNRKRRSLTFSSDASKTITVSTDGIPAAGQGIVLTATNPVQTLNYEDMGERIRQPFYAVSSATGGLLTVIETFD
jgi:hypothetical protein